ncbi:alpha-L-rhamnosidase [Granulicella mallensis]|nr:alpha-L-rhamnosidase [Granulicella mallensis]
MNKGNTLSPVQRLCRVDGLRPECSFFHFRAAGWIRRMCWLMALLAAVVPALAQGIHLERLKTEGRTEALGLDEAAPRLSWSLASTAAGVLQSKYRVLVATSPEGSERRRPDDLVWDSQVVQSADPYTRYKGKPLQSRRRYFWTVEVWTGLQQKPIAKSSWFETSYMSESEWTGQWIAGAPRREVKPTAAEGIADDACCRASDTRLTPTEFCRPVGVGKGGRQDTQGECLEVRPVPRLRKSFLLEPIVRHGRILRARLYAAGLGYNEMSLNGTTTSPNVLDPNFTNYAQTVLYTTSDVTTLLRQQASEATENVLAAELGSGQYDQDADGANWAYITAEWRGRPRLRASLYVTYEDGTEQRIDSDGSWQKSEAGPIRYAGLYRGETYDARLEQRGWDRPGFDASGWLPVERVETPQGTLRAAMGTPTRVVAERPAGRRTTLRPGVFVYDTGQERAGWATISVAGVPAGTAIEVHYSDQTDKSGEVNSSGCCIAGQVQTDYYIAKGTGTREHPEMYAPRFSYKGFQYIELSALHEAPLPDSAEVRVVSVQEVRTDLPVAGTFISANPRLNRLEQMVRGSIAENYVGGIITDTPEYEKNAWTGDAALTAPTASLLFDTEQQYRKSFVDMRDAQQSSGELTLLAPGAQGYGRIGGFGKSASCCGATPVWDAFWFVLPWESYQRYGDLRSLEETYPLMKRYLREWVPRWVNKDGDDSPYTLRAGLGDWDPPKGREGEGPTAISIPPAVYSSTTAYYAYLTSIAADSARALGKMEEAGAFDADFAKIREAYNAKWWDVKLGYYHEASDKTLYQEQQVVPLAFGLVPEGERVELERKLIADVLDTRAGHEEVGIVGARWILPVLSRAAEEGIPRAADAAYTIATQRTYPSYGYWMDAGWTTLGETWELTSRTRTHHMYGSVGQWMYENLAGIRVAQPGYREILFSPILPEKLQSASATYDSVRGPIRASWKRTGCSVLFTFSVPPNATAVASLPVTGEESVLQVGSIVHAHVTTVGRTAFRSSYRFGSGIYSFERREKSKSSSHCVEDVPTSASSGKDVQAATADSLRE